MDEILEVLVTQSCSTLCNPMGYSPKGSSIHGILQARILEWGLPFPSPGDLPDPGIEPRFPALQADSLPLEPPRKLITGNEYVPIKFQFVFSDSSAYNQLLTGIHHTDVNSLNS